MSVQLFHGDCLDVMRTLPVVDVVVTDPPYGIGENNKKNLSRSKPFGSASNRKSGIAKAIDYGDFDWDTMPVSEQHIKMILSISKNQIIFGGNYYAHLLPPSSSWIVWDKVNSGDFADCELAWTSHKKAVRIFRYMWNGMLKQKPEKRLHPTQKPLALMCWIIENYTSPGDTILDPFMGSGTTGVACVQLGRNFIGIEKNADYFAIAQKRIAAAQLQIPMFTAPVAHAEQAALFG